MASLLIALAVGGRHLYLVHKDKKRERRQRKLLQEEMEGCDRNAGSRSGKRVLRKGRSGRRREGDGTDNPTVRYARRDSQETMTRNRLIRDEDSASRLSEQSTLVGDDEAGAGGVQGNDSYHSNVAA
ncbi:hypothetical protein JDV02_000135 [Purpureocillium takamizusanense]|uniref:Uncharacterized protein n=1 Tax=Purpureocillium takamizusanense TaxID=2060973 RepID=A0A9Q8Q6J9_9HYPO|nr:uncharacterized protein JDV02_000135 [Purpureocillium takamizusanense]UNI13387.1 hypothetical protein JDV02_000135 [Purpureocillium takamizusanense]